jgi:nicotinate-nucleotide adenylyltransferase
VRLGLLGGSFDPPHLGHLHVARAARDELRLDRLRLVPASQPPHKLGRALAPDGDRVAMLELLVREEPWLEIDRRELARGGTSFTYDTLVEVLREIDGGRADLYFILGSDSLVDLPTWHRAAELVRLATIVTVPRDAKSVQLGLAQIRKCVPEAAARIADHVLDVEPLPVSSTSIRSRVKAGLPVDELVPASVAAYIARRGLYRD